MDTDIVTLKRADPRSRSRLEPDPDRVFWSINVLLVEDDEADTEIILNVLKRHPSVSSIHASNEPTVLLKHLAEGQWRPDLILLDVQMPRVNGFMFLEALREIPAMARTPVVFLSGSRLAVDAQRASESTAASYIVKPDTYAELQARLDTVVRRAISGLWRR
jgi:DNA-binding response OmpR family regulator